MHMVLDNTLLRHKTNQKLAFLRVHKSVRGWVEVKADPKIAIPITNPFGSALELEKSEFFDSAGVTSRPYPYVCI